MNRGHFFAIGRETFAAACDLGLNPALLLLLLARGSGPDNRTTHWSANAGGKHYQMRWSSAKTAIVMLASAELVRRITGSTRPTYVLEQRGELLWLPNALVDGVGAETSPLRKLRETQDVGVTRVLIELYGSQNLREDGGVSPEILWQTYQRSRVGQYGSWVVWRFHNPQIWFSRGAPVLSVHLRTVTRKERAAGIDSDTDLVHRLGLLASLGLFTWIPYLYDGPTGEPLVPVHEESEDPWEAELARTAYQAALRCLTTRQVEVVQDQPGLLLPVPAHMDQVTVKGVARLRYRPRTALTSAWRAETIARCQQAIATYQGIAPDVL